MAITQITVTGTYKLPNGTAATGSVSFQLSETIFDGAGNLVVAPALIRADLDVNGAFSQVLYANNDPTTTPTGTTYEVLEEIDEAEPLVFNVVIPYDAAGATVDISDLTRLEEE